jgi:UDP-3-O-[3-hydroxymyristoyl] N-acetylglucosamine deacetylase
MTSYAQLTASRMQRTLAQPAVVTGFGYWSGRDVRVEFKPAPADAGRTFVRTDLGPQARIPASVKHRVESPRRTTLVSGEANVEMVEHILAALAGLQIDNCEIWVDAPEMPGCDGSSLAFVQALDAAGYVTQDLPVRQLVVTDRMRVGDEHTWIEAWPAKQIRGLPDLSIKFRIDYGRGNAIGRQSCQLAVSPDAFRRELAAARTFLLKSEADWLRAQGLAGRVTNGDLLVFDTDGPIDNELRFEDECVRHKALDLVGDLALAGCEVAGQFIAHCSGHRLNAEMVRALLLEGRRVGHWRKSA